MTSSGDHHQCGQLVLNHLGLAKKPMPLGGGHTLNCPAQVIPANSLLYEPKASVKKPSRTLYDALSSCQVGLTNLIVHFRSYLLSNVRQCLAHQSKVRSFGSPVGAL
jgi:hypothetical protein